MTGSMMGRALTGPDERLMEELVEHLLGSAAGSDATVLVALEAPVEVLLAASGPEGDASSWR